MKIAIVNRHPKDVLGGSEMQCGNIASGLAARGHDVLFIAPAGKDGVDYGTNYTVKPVQSNGESIAAAVLAFNPDIVYWRFNKYYLYKAAKKIAAKNIPIVFAISHIDDTRPFTYRENPRDGFIPLLRSIKQGCVMAANHLGYKFISGVTSNNPDFLNRINVKVQTFVPNSVDVDAVPFSWPRPFVMWVANIKAQKQPEIFINLAKHFAGRGVDFLMVGKIQSQDYKWVEQEPAKVPNFHWLGFKTPQDVNGILAQSLFLVHTCRPEGFPNNFIQAWMQKKPTITYAFDPAGYIEKNNLGFYAKSDWNALVAKVEDYIDHPETREKIGNHAYEFANGNFSLDGTVDTLERFLTQILADKRAA